MMKKKTLIIIGVVAVIAIVAVLALKPFSKRKQQLPSILSR